MLSFGLKTQLGGRGWHDVGTVSAVGRQLRSALCVKVKLHYAYKVRNIGRVRPRLRCSVLC